MAEKLSVVYALVMVIGVLGAGGDLLLYAWAQSRANWQLAAGLLVWVLSLLAFAFLLRYSNRSLSVVFVMVAALHTLIVLGWDLYIQFRRPSGWEVLGMLLALAGVATIEISHALKGEEH